MSVHATYTAALTGGVYGTFLPPETVNFPYPITGRGLYEQRPWHAQTLTTFPRASKAKRRFQLGFSGAARATVGANNSVLLGATDR
jgi:hypothetical protein